MTLDSEQLANARQLAGLVIDAGLPDNLKSQCLHY